MRITTSLFVSALVRRVFGAGGFAAVVNRGAEEAGAVFIITRNRTAEVELYAPASQTSYDSSKPDERRFALLLAGDGAVIDARLEKEKRFDPDLWVVEIEPDPLPIADLIRIAAP